MDDDDVPQRRQTFPSSQIFNDVYNNLKSRSMTNIKTTEGSEITRSKSNLQSVADKPEVAVPETTILPNKNPVNTLSKPKLVKQKKSICEEDADEALDEPTEMKQVNNNKGEIRLSSTRRNVLKQRSLNEELMSTDRLKEKEKVRRNIQKQTSLNEDLICHRQHTFDSIKDSIFSVSAAKKLHLIKTGFTKKIKNSTTNIEKVAGGSLKNGFVKMFQNWTSSDLISPSIPEDDSLLSTKKVIVIEKTTESERRHSKEDGSDSSKDSSLQSDTSVDSEDSFASVIFVPKCDPLSPSLSPGPTSPRLSNSSVPNSPRIKQSSCPTSPRIKQMPLSVYPLTKQLSSPKPTISKFSEVTSPTDSVNKTAKTDITPKPLEPAKDKAFIENLAKKYAVQQIPKFKKTPLNSGSENTEKNAQTPKNKEETLKEIKELLSKKGDIGVKTTRANFPIVRRASVNNGKSVAKPLPKLLCLELFNPETDDKDSDSSAVSSPDSVDSVISVTQEKSTKSSSSKFSFSESDAQMNSKTTLLEAAAEVANSLDEAVDRVIKSSPRARRREIKTGEVISVMQRQYSSETTPLLSDVEMENSWNDECHKHLTDFANRLSEKLLQEIDQYQEQSKKNYQHHIDDPYINRLSQELSDLSKLSAEIQRQNEYLSKLSASDKLFSSNVTSCKGCEVTPCRCHKAPKKDTTQTKQIISGDNGVLSECNKTKTEDSLYVDRYNAVDNANLDIIGR